MGARRARSRRQRIARWSRRAFALGLTALAASLAPAAAGPRDRTLEALVSVDGVLGSASWDNRAVKALVKFARCRHRIVVRRAPALAGQPVVCLVGSDAFLSILPGGALGTTVVFSGAFDARGKLRLVADLRSIGCGSVTETLSLNRSFDCYATDVDAYDPAATCGAAGMLWVAPDPAAAPDALVGVCQALSPGTGERMPPPAAPLLAADGVFLPGS